MLRPARYPQREHILSPSFDLSAASEMIADTVSLMQGEVVAVSAAYCRVSRFALSAKVSQPGYDQSTRDGFAVAVGGDEVAHGMQFRVTGEAAAGGTRKIILAEGTACRIMTGGMVPAGAVRVVPQEDCGVGEGLVTVPAPVMQRENTYIQKRGSQIAGGEPLVAAGTILQPEHLAMLATTGHTEIEVYRRSRIGFFSTGSELVDSPDQLVPGLKVSANRYLLGGLVRQFLAEGEDLGIVKDTREDLHQAFARLGLAAYDLAISTGGMGPGKYDLLEEAFCEAGGQVIFRSLDMRPGRAVLFGRLGNTLFFGLPGPPEAVRTLMNEIVGPALLQLQGVNECGPVAVQARLRQRIAIPSNEVLQLKAGILSLADGSVHVRMAGRREIATCFILLPSGRDSFEAGSLVEVHLACSPAFSTSG